MSYDTKKMKKRMLATRLILALILTAFFIYFVYQIALEDKGDAPQQASTEAEDTFVSWMNNSLYSSNNYSIRLYLTGGCPEETLDFSSLEDLPFWNWVNAMAKGNGGPLDIAVDRVNKTAAFSNGGEYQFLSVKDGRLLFSLPQEDGSYSTLQTSDPETLRAVDGILFLDDPEFLRAAASESRKNTAFPAVSALPCSRKTEQPIKNCWVRLIRRCTLQRLTEKTNSFISKRIKIKKLRCPAKLFYWLKIMFDGACMVDLAVNNLYPEYSS